MVCAGEDVNGYGEEWEGSKKNKEHCIVNPSCMRGFNSCESVHFVYMHKTYFNTVFTKDELALFALAHKSGYNKMTIK